MEMANDSGQKRRPVDTTRHHRENGWDYRGRGIYHFTLVVDGRVPLFGALVGDNAETAYVRYNTFGHRVYRMLSGLPQFYKNKGFALKILTLKVMPDHIHLVIQVLEPLPQSIGTVVRGFKSACTKIYKQDYYSGENAAEVHGNGGAGVLGNGGAGDCWGYAADKDSGENTAGLLGYGGAGVLGNGGAGVLGNGTGKEGKGYAADKDSGENAAGVHGNGGAGLLGNGTGKEGKGYAADKDSGENAAGVHGNGGTGMLGGGNAFEEAVLVQFARIFASRGSIWQQDPAHYHERILHAPGQLRRMIDYVQDNPRRLWIKSHHPDLFRLHRQTDIDGLLFTSLGNHFLLDWPDRQMVEMSRSATDEQIQQRLQAALTAARNGTVTYTAAISRGEKTIARTLRERGYPLVVLLNDGFPQEGSPHEHFFKPGGVYFEACSAGRLLLLEPTEKTILDTSAQTAVEITLRRKASARHYNYTPLPATSQRYRFVALNEIAKKLTER